MSRSPASDVISGLQTGPNGERWVQTVGTVTVTTSTTQCVFNVMKDLAGGRIYSLLVNRDGTAWVGTIRGLFAVASEPTARVRSIPSPQADSILSILQDREGNYWIGTDDSGLHGLRQRKFQTEPVAAAKRVKAVVQAAMAKSPG